MPHIDFADVKGPEPLPPGDYFSEVVSGKDGVSKNNNQKISLRLKVLSGEYTDRQFFDDLTFTEDSAWRVKQAMLAMGFDAEYKGDVTGEDFVGCQCIARLTIKTGDIDKETGKMYDPRNRVAKYLAPSGIDVEDLVD